MVNSHLQNWSTHTSKNWPSHTLLVSSHLKRIYLYSHFTGILTPIFISNYILVIMLIYYFVIYTKNSSGMESIFKLKLRIVGCFGRLTCHLLLATRIIADCVGSEGQGSPTVTCLCIAGWQTHVASVLYFVPDLH